MANDSANRLLARVKQLRLDLGLTQEAFAEKAGLGYKYYQSVEAGRKRDLRFSTLEKLARACDLEVWELLNFERDQGILAEESPETSTVRSARGRRKG